MFAMATMAHSEINETQACPCIGTQKPWCGSLGRRYCFGDKLAGQSAEMLRYSPEAFNGSGLRLSFGFSLLQMMWPLESAL